MNTLKYLQKNFPVVKQNDELLTEPEFYFLEEEVYVSVKLPFELDTTHLQFGEFVNATKKETLNRCKIYLEAVVRPFFPPLERTKIVALACTEPRDYGLLINRWTIRDLQIQIVKSEIITQIHYTSVAAILNDADLQPHRILYWKQPLAEDFEKKAASILWYYEHVSYLFSKRESVFCLDEKTQIQAISPRQPDILPVHGCPHRREHEYIRHGIANLLLIYNLADGTIWGDTTERNNSHNFCSSLENHVKLFPKTKKIHYILDNGSSHISKATQEWIKHFDGRIQFHFTPVHASWLNQAELTLSAYSRRYLKGGVWHSTRNLINHIHNSILDYNQQYAYPFKWSFTRHKMKNWYSNNFLQN